MVVWTNTLVDPNLKASTTKSVNLKVVVDEYILVSLNMISTSNYLKRTFCELEITHSVQLSGIRILPSALHSDDLDQELNGHKHGKENFQ